MYTEKRRTRTDDMILVEQFLVAEFLVYYKFHIVLNLLLIWYDFTMFLYYTIMSELIDSLK